jgi:tetraprenyl-beta-curcumene synthase
MATTAGRRLRLMVAFADAALHYWITVFPLVRRETRRWTKRAEEIPDPVLRRIALETQRAERGNYEGAGAFATFVPLRRRATVVHAVVAYQLAYDYADSLAEMPAADSVANGRALHEALHAALSPDTPHPDYYRHHDHRDDGGYLVELVDACRASVASLPSHATITPHLSRVVARMIEYQALIHCGEASPSDLAAWARSHAPPHSGLRWWEAAAACASSLVVFALIAASTQPAMTDHEATAIERAYVPWIGGLHVLLDSLVDWPSDLAAGHHSLIAHYASCTDMAFSMGTMADAAVYSARSLPRPKQHEMLLAAMAGLYLARRTALMPYASETTDQILRSLGDLAWPVMRVHRARHLLGLATNWN